jgi:hypothetical protein
VRLAGDGTIKRLGKLFESRLMSDIAIPQLTHAPRPVCLQSAMPCAATRQGIQKEGSSQRSMLRPRGSLIKHRRYNAQGTQLCPILRAASDSTLILTARSRISRANFLISSAQRCWACILSRRRSASICRRCEGGDFFCGTMWHLSVPWDD